MDRPLRLLVVLGLLLPKATAALAAMGLLGETIVICTGEGMTTITLDAQGKPISTTTSGEPCGLLAPVSHLAVPSPDWTPAERRLAAARAAPPQARPPALTGVPPPRAPPFA